MFADWKVLVKEHNLRNEYTSSTHFSFSPECTFKNGISTQCIKFWCCTCIRNAFDILVIRYRKKNTQTLKNFMQLRLKPQLYRISGLCRTHQKVPAPNWWLYFSINLNYCSPNILFPCVTWRTTLLNWILMHAADECYRHSCWFRTFHWNYTFNMNSTFNDFSMTVWGWCDGGNTILHSHILTGTYLVRFFNRKIFQVGIQKL